MSFDRWECETPEDILTAVLFEGVERIAAKEKAQTVALSRQLSQALGHGSLYVQLGNARLEERIALVEAAAKLGPHIQPTIAEKALAGECLEDLLRHVMERAGYEYAPA